MTTDGRSEDPPSEETPKNASGASENTASGSEDPAPSEVPHPSDDPARSDDEAALTGEKSAPFSEEAWGQAARATVLLVLLGMALVVFVHLGGGGDWVDDFLRKNTLPMDDRMALIYQMVGGGSLLGAVCVIRLLFSKRGPREAALWEQWAWFFSPLILLPAIPVVMEYRVWRTAHEDLLALVLFGGILAEFFFLRAYGAVPKVVTRTLTKFFAEEDRPDAKQDASRAGRLLQFIEKHGALLTVVVAALAYGAFMSFYTIRWHHKLGTATFDLGINDNLLYGGLHGKFNQSPVIFPEDPQKYIANHVKLGLYTFLPIYALFPRAETLLSIQSVSLGLGAIPLFLFAKKRIPAWWAVALSLCYLANYPMHGANFYEMKLPPTAAAVVLLCIFAIDDKRWVLGGVSFVWALIMREDLPIPLVVVGGVFLLSGHRAIAGALMAGVGTIWFILLRFRFMNEVGTWWFPNMYEDLWAEPERGFQSVIKTLLSNPAYTLKHIFVEKKFWYLMHLLAPLMFLPMRRWWGWAALVPGAILTLLVTDYAPPTLFSFQYVMHWTPYLFIAACLVLSDYRKRVGEARGLAATTAMCLVSAALSYNYGAFPLRDGYLRAGYHKIDFDFSKEEAKTYEQVRKLVDSIPPDATVASTEHIGAHLSSRVGFYTLRRGSHGVEYIVADKKGLKLDRTKRTVQKAVNSGEYGMVGRYGEFVVFKKGADPGGNAAIIEEWKLDSKTSTRRRLPRDPSARADDTEEDDAEDEGGEFFPEAESEDDPPDLPGTAPRPPADSADGPGAKPKEPATKGSPLR